MATLEQLREHATDTLGLKVSSRTTKAELESMIDGYKNEDSPEPEIENLALKKGDNKVKIIIHSKDESETPIQLGINGYMYVIKPDVAVEVPDYVVEMLKTRVETRTNPKTGHTADVLRYPYTLLD